MGSLQRLYGNRPVLQIRNGFGGPPAPSVPLRPSQGGILQRKCACGGAAGMSGECEECSKKKRLRLQTKLKVSEAGDIYEQEADRIADRVMATPTHNVVSGALPRIQRFAGQPAGQAEAAPASVDQVLASPGRPLDPATRAFMEPRISHDLSRVRVHTDAKAAESAREVNALAYTVGRDVVFWTGQYDPVIPAGKRLLAHELTHVVQQSGAEGISAGQSNEKRGLSPISPFVSPVFPISPVGSGHGTIIQRQLPRPRPRMGPRWTYKPLPVEVPKPLPPTPLPPPVPLPVPHEEPKPEDQPKRGQCGSPDLPFTLVSFFPGPLGQGGRVKASPLTRCPGNTVGSKPQDRFYKDQFRCIDAAGKTGDWVRGHILHGETDRSGNRNLHGPGDTAANLIIIDQSLNQSMRSWIEDPVLKLVYGPLPLVLWMNAWVDSYYPGLPFFADSISVEYGPYDTSSGTEGPRWNFKQFILGRKPPNCPAGGFAGGVPPWMAAASTSGFQSTLQVCHHQLESRVFDVANGGLMVAMDAKWVARGPARPMGLIGPRHRLRRDGCPTRNYHIVLYKEKFGFDKQISSSERTPGRRVVLLWRYLDDASYYLQIRTGNLDDPGCCLEGNITVAPFDAPAPKPPPYMPEGESGLPEIV